MAGSYHFVIAVWSAKTAQSETKCATGKRLLTSSVRPVGVGAVSQRLIPTGERSSWPTHIAATVNASLCDSDEKLTAFLELERITHELAVSALLGDESN